MVWSSFIDQYESGLSYCGINTARSALPTIILLPGGSSFGNHPIVTRFLKIKTRIAALQGHMGCLCYLKTLSPLEELHLIGQELGSHVPAL